MSGLTEARLRKIIAEGETATVELKINAPRPSELADRITGLANARGGYLILGVEDSTLKITGVSDVKANIDVLHRAARQISPSIEFSPPEPEVFNLDGAKIVVATIPVSNGPIFQSGGVCWYRRGTHTIPLSVNEVLDMANQRNLVRWELKAAYGATMEDLDLEKVQAYLSRRETTRVRRFDNLERALIALKCAVNVDGVTVPTNAGLLFFGYEPQIALPQSEVVCVLLKDELGMGGYLDRKVLGGTLPELIDDCAIFLKKHIQVAGQVVGWQRVDTPEYAEEALREAVVNAVVHRDYSREGERIRLFVYPDRIEIHSPGLLLPGISLEQMQKGEVVSRLRNITLASLLGGLPGYIEQLGSGVRFMLNVTRQHKLPAPQFRELDEFVVTFYKGETTQTTITREPTATPAHNLTEQLKLRDIESRLKIAMNFVHQNGYITSNIHRELTGVSERTALHDMEALVKNGTLKRVGKARAARYVLP